MKTYAKQILCFKKNVECKRGSYKTETRRLLWKPFLNDAVVYSFLQKEKKERYLTMLSLGWWSTFILYSSKATLKRQDGRVQITHDSLTLKQTMVHASLRLSDTENKLSTTFFIHTV